MAVEPCAPDVEAEWKWVNAVSDVTARFLHAVKGEARACQWVTGRLSSSGKLAMQLEREKWTTKRTCYPTVEKHKKKKKITEGREIRTPREREPLLMGGVIYWNRLKKNSLSLSRRCTANNIDEVFIFRWGWPISYLPVIHFLCVELKKTLSIGSWDLISSPDEALSICFNKIQKIYWAKIGYHRKSYNSTTALRKREDGGVSWSFLIFFFFLNAPA